ncbi:MAG: LolA family protein [Actinomycetes bacterium]
MAVTASSRWFRYAAVPVVAALVAVIGLLAATRATAGGSPRLPARTAAQLLADVQEASLPAFSGTVKTSAHLGLPSIPDSFGSGGAFSPQSLLSGTQTFRVWVRDQEHQRVAWLGHLAELDAVHNGTDVWTYDSSKLAVTHATLPAKEDQRHATEQATAPTPMEAAHELLKNIDPSTIVTVSRTARVAGRPAYQLQLSPRDTRSLVSRAQIAVDSKTSLPLRVQVFARNSGRAALSVAFSSISFSTPRSSIFQFAPPKGSKVQRTSVSSLVGTPRTHRAKVRGAPDVRTAAPEPNADHAMSSQPRTLGSGWTAVEEVAGGSLNRPVSRLLDKVSTPVAGGRLVTTALVSILIADDGNIYAGAIDGTDLQKVAATGRGL